MVSYQSEGSCFCLSAHGPLLFIRYVVSGLLAHVPLSLLTSSYLTAGKVSIGSEIN